MSKENHRNKEFEYFAFISYKREDEKWAKWLQKKLESYSLPTSIRKENPTLPNKIRPVFRDQSELSGGNLKAEIEKGLNNSKYLIVICSPQSAKSPWVSKEVQHFIDQGRENYIIPFIIGGTPNASNPEYECFPEGLRQLTGEKELLGININEMGRNAAVIKVIAQMFNLRFDSLWQRYKRRKYKYGIIISLILILIVSSVAFSISSNYIKNLNRAIYVSSSAVSMVLEGDKYGGIRQLSLLLKENLPVNPLVEGYVRKVFEEDKNLSLSRIPIHSKYPQVSINPVKHSNQFIYGDDEGLLHLISLGNGNEVTCKKLFESRFSELFYSEKGDLIIANSDNGTLLLDSNTLTVEDSIPHCGIISMDKDIICLYDGDIRIYDIAERRLKLLQNFSNTELKSSTGNNRKRCIDISMSLGLIAFGSTDKTVSLWTIEDQKLKWMSPPIHKDYVSCVHFDEKNNQLISCGLDGKIIVWDIASGNEIIKPFGHRSDGYRGGIYSLSYYDKERTLFTASSDKTIGIWNLENNNIVHKPLEGHSNTIRDLDYKNGYLVSASENDEIRIWNYNCAPTYKVLQVASSSCYLHKGMDNKLFVHSDDGINYVSCENGKITNTSQIIGYPVFTWDVKFFDNQLFIYEGSDNCGLKSYKIKEDKLSTNSFAFPNNIIDVDKNIFSSDLAILSDRNVYKFDPSTNLIMDSVEVIGTYHQVCYINNHEVIISGFDSIAKVDLVKKCIVKKTYNDTKGRRPIIVKRSKNIYVGYSNGLIRVINTKNLNTTKEIKAHPQPISYIEVNDDESKLLSISSNIVTYRGENNEIKIWDLNYGNLLYTYSLRNVNFNSAIFDEEQSRIIASDNSGNMYIIPFFTLNELMQKVQLF